MADAPAQPDPPRDDPAPPGTDAGGAVRRDPTAADVVAARRRIDGHVDVTPLVRLHGARGREAPPARLKLENLQVTGSFKARGAANLLIGLHEEERRRGVVTCSSGNHGLAVAWSAGGLGVPATVCVPRWIDPAKLAAIRDHGAEAVLAGDSYDEAEARARELAREGGATWVDPFDDPRIIAGQGTLGLEILDALPGVGTVLVPLSGGGLLAGVALALRSAGRPVRVVAVAARRADVMVRSLAAGRPVEAPEERTLATALSGGIGRDNRWTLRLVGALADRILVVDEESIAAAMAHAFHAHRIVVEGGGAVALAALLDGKHADEPEPVVAVVSGGNVSPGTLLEVVEGRRAPRAGR